MRKKPVNVHDRDEWMIVDNFAGGGGASTGIEMAIGRSPNVAINHDPEALAMHKANHRWTRHYEQNVWDIDPRVVVRNRRVGLAWFSPDCTHHSKARGGKPIRNSGKKSRSLAWVVVKWAIHVKPRVIILENVEEFANWGPVVKKVGSDGAPVLGADGLPWYVPCVKRRGSTFRRWVKKLERLGYVVEWKELRACDYGAPTVRKRLFVIARCDGQPIVWPEPTHGKPESPDVLSGVRAPWRTAAEIIDWSLPCPSIFMSPEDAKLIGVKRPLAENTLNRIAAGLKRYVLNCAKPFIVSCNHGGDWFRGRGIDQPMATVTGSKGDALVNPFMQAYHGPTVDGSVSRSSEIDEPVRTLDTQNRFGIVAPFLGSPAHSKTTGRGKNVWSPEEPLPTTTSSNDKCVIAPYAVPRYSEREGQEPRAMSIEQPASTIVPTGNGTTIIAPVMTAAQHGGSNRSPALPLQTICASTKDQNAVIAPILTREFGRSIGGIVDSPTPTVMPGGQGKTSLVQAFLAQHNTGVVGHPATKPLSTMTGRGTQQQIVEASFLSHNYTSNTGGGNGDPETPLTTVTAGGQHHMQVKAFLQKYYGSGGQHQDCRGPMHTVPTKHRLGIVTVEDIDYEIVDIGMRMLTARELFRAQGFPDSYVIDCLAPNKKGTLRPMPKDAQVRMCGNSVCPDLAAELVKANCGFLKKPVKTGQRQLELAGV